MQNKNSSGLRIVVIHPLKIDSINLLERIEIKRKIILSGSHKAIDLRLDAIDYYDNDDENISSKNNYYGELSAIYFILRNLNFSWINLEHYRRLFSKSNTELVELDDEYIEKKLLKYDYIVQKKYFFKEKNVESFYEKNFFLEDFNRFSDAILFKYPDFKKSLGKLKKLSYFYPSCMMIAKKEDFEAYYNWLFEILFYSENKIVENGKLFERSVFHQRVFAYLAEIFFWVWIDYNKSKVLEFDILHLEREYDSWSKILFQLKRLIPYKFRVFIKIAFKKLYFVRRTN